MARAVRLCQTNEVEELRPVAETVPAPRRFGLVYDIVPGKIFEIGVSTKELTESGHGGSKTGVFRN